MTEAPILGLNRVILGLGASGGVAESVEAAAIMAAAVGSGIQCLMVGEEDLINAAGLPFARAYGPGGLATELSAAALEASFDRMFREAERAIARACSGASIPWRMHRPRGELIGEIVSVLERGDAVVLGAHAVEGRNRPTIEILRELLTIAAAVVLPPPRKKPAGPVMAMGGGAAIGIAEAIARSLRLEMEKLEPETLATLRRPATAIVMSLAEVERLGERALLRGLAGAGAMAVLVGGESRS